MNQILSLLVYTANILGVFNDPFEFEGDYGYEVNAVRQTIFEAVVSKKAIAQNCTDAEIRAIINHEIEDSQIEQYRSEMVVAATEADRRHGPTMRRVASP